MPDKILQEKNATCSGVNYSQMPLIPSSGTSQKVNVPEKRNVCMPCAEINGKDCWVTALTTVMESLLSRINFTRDTNTD